MGLFGFRKKKYQCTCGCGCKEQFDDYGRRRAYAFSESAHAYGKSWRSDSTICMDCNMDSHVHATVNSNNYQNITSGRVIHKNDNELLGYIDGILYDEFKILLKLSFIQKGFKIHKIKKEFITPTDCIVFMSNEKKRLFHSKKISNYIVHIDRTYCDYTKEWLYALIRTIKNDGVTLDSLEKIFIMNTNSHTKLVLKNELKHKIKFITGKKFIKYIFNGFIENMLKLKDTYPQENQLWNNKSPEQQKDFCSKIGITYRKYVRLWKYYHIDQARLIYNLCNNSKQNNTENDDEEKSSYSSTTNLNDCYKILDISSNASPTEITKKFRILLQFYHPDKFQNRTEQNIKIANQKTIEVTEAHKKLKEAGKAS